MSTATLQEARTFLHELLVEWNHAVLDEKQLEALPHLTTILDAMEPVVVKDAHRTRAEEIVGMAGREPNAAERIEQLATAIASAENRGRLKSLDLIESGWDVIANSFGGNWDQASAEWRAAAERYRDAYHALLKEK